MNDFLPAKLRDSVHRGSDGRIVIDSLGAYLVSIWMPAHGYLPFEYQAHRYLPYG